MFAFLALTAHACAVVGVDCRFGPCDEQLLLRGCLPPFPPLDVSPDTVPPGTGPPGHDDVTDLWGGVACTGVGVAPPVGLQQAPLPPPAPSETGTQGVATTQPPVPPAQPLPDPLRSLSPLGEQPGVGSLKTEAGWLFGPHQHRTPAQEAALSRVLDQFKGQFASDFSDLGCYQGPLGPMPIPLKEGVTRVFTPNKKSTLASAEIERAKVEPLIAAGIVRRSPTSDFASLNVVVTKKDHLGQFTDTRLCHNYCRLNDATDTKVNGMHPAEEIQREVLGAGWYSKLDMKAGYFQIPMREEDYAKTAFWYQRQLYEYTRVPFGLKNAPAEFQERMDRALQDHGLSGFCRVYIDDLLIHSATFEEHVQHVQQVLSMLRSINMRAHPAKSLWACDIIEFLGHNVSSTGLTPQEAKVKAIRALPPPVNLKALRRALGFINYYRCYVPGFSGIAAPLNALTRSDAVWRWGQEEAAALQRLKDTLCDPGCALRSADPKRPFILHTDFSNVGLGAVLGQLDDEGNEYLVACTSRSLIKTERDYASYKGEMLAAVWGVKSMDYYLRGAHFTLVTDHAPLLFLMKNQQLNGQYARWACILQEYSFQLVHRPGAKHVTADALSRDPLSDEEDSTGARLDEPSPPWSQFQELQWSGARLAEEQPLSAGTKAAMMGVSALAALLADRADTTPSPDPPGWGAAALVGSFMDSYGLGSSLPGCPPVEEELEELVASDALAEARGQLQATAAQWVAAAAPHLPPPAPGSTARLGARTGGWNPLGIRPTEAIDTRLLDGEQLARMWAEGVTLFEPFGGMAAGAEMLLRQGIPIRRYIYADTNPRVRTIARHRLGVLSDRYGSDLFPAIAWERAFDTVCHDVYNIGAVDLDSAGASDGSQWVVVAGWECQDLSLAGSGEGLGGRASSSFFPLVRLLGALQQLQPQRPPLFFLENTGIKTPASRAGAQIEASFRAITERVGGCVELDAARVGSFAHRLRDYWTNLADAEQLQAVFDRVQRDPALRLESILGEGRFPSLCRSAERPPWYPANVPGQPIRVLPTLVAYLGAEGGSYAFRDRGPGMVQTGDGQFAPLTMAERERALGYEAGDTAGPSSSEKDRHEATGRCMDANALQCLFAVGMALRLAQGAGRGQPPGCQLGEGSARQVAALAAEAGSNRPPTHSWEAVAAAAALAENEEEMLAPPQTGQPESTVNTGAGALSDGEGRAASEEARQRPRSGRDIWLDSNAMELIQAGKIAEPRLELLSAQERERVVRRSKAYRWLPGSPGAQSHGLWGPGVLLRQMGAQEWKAVPPPVARAELVRKMHEEVGHFGRRRTTCMVMLSYWWPGLYQTVRDCVQQCQRCHQVRAVFNAQRPQLQPLPISCMFYRWHVDLFGPCPKSTRGNSYVLVAIEALSKHCELVPLVSKEATETAFAFHHAVLGRFGACAEVVTDQGNEFQGAFAELLAKAFIEHRHTSAYHPQSNGLAERCVQTIKRSLKKIVDSDAEGRRWDELLPWVALGYRVTPQESTKLSPYQMLYAQLPMLPSALHDHFVDSLDLNDEEAAASTLVQRAKAVAHQCIMAGQNLAIAQQRDTLRYARVHDGSYLPLLRRFEVGDFVYTRKAGDSAIPSCFRALANPEVLRVKEKRESGVVVLQGRDGQLIEENVVNCAPCHLPINNPVVDWSRFRPPKDYPCCVCHHPDRERLMLLCDWCHDGYHIGCLEPPLKRVPKGSWLCPACKALEGKAPANPRAAGPSKTPAASPSKERAPAPAVAAPRRSGRLRLAGSCASWCGPDWEPCEAGHLGGRTVLCQEQDGVAGQRSRLGVLSALGDDRGGQPEYTVQYAVGASEGISGWQAWLRLLPASDLPGPAQALAGALDPPAASLDELAGGAWDLHSLQGVRAALQALTPSQWSDATVGRVATAARQWECENMWTPRLADGSDSMSQAGAMLVAAVNLWWAAGLIDPCAYPDGNLIRGLERCGVRILSNSPNLSAAGGSFFHPLHPSAYAELRKSGGCEGFVFQPPIDLLEIALPLAVRAARKVVCCLVPRPWLTQVQGPIAAWLQALDQENRVLVVYDAGAGPNHGQLAWVVIFGSALARCLMCRKGFERVGLLGKPV